MIFHVTVIFHVSVIFHVTVIFHVPVIFHITLKHGRKLVQFLCLCACPCTLFVEHQPSMFLLCELAWKNLWSLYTTSPLCFCFVSWPGITRAHACKHTCTHAYRLLDPLPPCVVVVCRAPDFFVFAVWAALEKSVIVVHYQPSMFLLCELAWNNPCACLQTHMHTCIQAARSSSTLFGRCM